MERTWTLGILDTFYCRQKYAHARCIYNIGDCDYLQINLTVVDLSKLMLGESMSNCYLHKRLIHLAG
jgi:hypothetical protein